MGNVHLVIPDIHAHYKNDNSRADLIGRLIVDLRPDVVVNMGDMFDMPSLSSYDRGKKGFQGRTYRADVDAGLEFDERLWAPIKKAKKRRPHSVYLIGNHDERIARAIEYQPELEGMISYKDLELHKNYDVVVDYEGRTPGSIEIDGIQYGHYFPSGIMGRPISGDVRPAHSLLLKRHVSTTQAHTHTLDWATQTKGDGTKIMGLFAGCFLDYEPDYAGSTSDMWWRGVVIKHEVENGVYDPEFISLERLKKLYDTGND